MSTLETMQEIFRLVFDDDSIVLNPEMTANDVDGWDSLSHINLILAIENKFNIRFSQRELLTFSKVGDLKNAIERKIA